MSALASLLFFLVAEQAFLVFAHLGGVGLYTSMRDYLTLLRHILRNKGKPSPRSTETSLQAPYPCDPPDDLPVQGSRLLSPSAAGSLFQPTLAPRGSEFLDSFIMVYKGLQHSTGLALMGEDVPGMRKKGSGWCTYSFAVSTSSCSALTTLRYLCVFRGRLGRDYVLARPDVGSCSSVWVAARSAGGCGGGEAAAGARADAVCEP